MPTYIYEPLNEFGLALDGIELITQEAGGTIYLKSNTANVLSITADTTISFEADLTNSSKLKQILLQVHDPGTNTLSFPTDIILMGAIPTTLPEYYTVVFEYIYTLQNWGMGIIEVSN